MSARIEVLRSDGVPGGQMLVIRHPDASGVLLALVQVGPKGKRLLLCRSVELEELWGQRQELAGLPDDAARWLPWGCTLCLDLSGLQTRKDSG